MKELENKESPITTDEQIDFHFTNDSLETWDDLMAQFTKAKEEKLQQSLKELPDEYQDFFESLKSLGFKLVKQLDGGQYIHSQWALGPLYCTVYKQGIYAVYNVETHEEFCGKVNDITVLNVVVMGL